MDFSLEDTLAILVDLVVREHPCEQFTPFLSTENSYLNRLGHTPSVIWMACNKVHTVAKTPSVQ